MIVSWKGKLIPRPSGVTCEEIDASRKTCPRT